MTNTTHKDIAVDFLKMTAAGQVEQAFERYAALDFRHHNPHFAGDAAAIGQMQPDPMPNQLGMF